MSTQARPNCCSSTRIAPIIGGHLCPPRLVKSKKIVTPHDSRQKNVFDTHHLGRVPGQVPGRRPNFASSPCAQRASLQFANCPLQVDMNYRGQRIGVLLSGAEGERGQIFGRSPGHLMPARHIEVNRWRNSPTAQ